MRYGYGVAITEGRIEAVSTARLLKLIHLAPEYEAHCLELLRNSWKYNGDLKAMSVMDILEIIADADNIGPVLREVIEEAEGINLEYTSDEYNSGEDYLVLEPCYPWTYNQQTRELTENRLAQILVKYISVVSDSECYQIKTYDYC